MTDIPAGSFPDDFSDCVRDVLAMTEAYLLSENKDEAVAEEGTRHFHILLGYADTVGCLKVAVPLLAAGWRFASAAKAEMLGTSTDEEMSKIMAMFRDELERLPSAQYGHTLT